MNHKLKKGIKGIWYYSLAHTIYGKEFEKKYLTGRWFSGRLNGMCSKGWKWVVNDARASRRLHVNEESVFPVAPNNIVINSRNIEFDPDDLNNFQSSGCYFQAIGKITIGRGTYIGPNVGLITSNHDSRNPAEHLPPKEIIIGEQCWIGMNSVILPGVELGPNTVVGAGSVVTKSFKEGHSIIAGNPAKIIKIVNE